MAKSYQDIMNEARAAVPELSPQEVRKRIEGNGKQVAVLDVREREEYRQGYVPGATSTVVVPLGRLPSA